MTSKKGTPQQQAAERREVILTTLADKKLPCLINYLRAVVNTKTKQGINEPRIYQDIKRLEKDGRVTVEPVISLGQAFGISRYRGQKLLLIRLVKNR
jgi:hypothetical protein